MTTKTDEQERKAFEANEKARFGYGKDTLVRYPADEHEYYMPLTQARWEGWQDRAALQSPPFSADDLAQEIRRVDGKHDLGAGRLAEALMPFIQRAPQSQKPTHNDLMLSGVIRMPFDMAMADELSRLQFYHRAQQALNELEALQSQDREDAQRYRALVDSGLFVPATLSGSSIWGLHMSGTKATKAELDKAIDHARRIEGGKNERT